MNVKRLATIGASALLGAALLLSAGCVRVDLDSDTETGSDSATVDLESAKEARVTVDLGAGEANLVLGDLLLQRLNVNLGAGNATIDLSGEPREDLEADINAGVGELTLVVPRSAGVRIIGYRDGLGSYQADGFTIDGDYLVNDAYGSAAVTYDIELRRGVGEVVIRMAD